MFEQEPILIGRIFTQDEAMDVAGWRIVLSIANNEHDNNKNTLIMHLRAVGPSVRLSNRV